MQEQIEELRRRFLASHGQYEHMQRHAATLALAEQLNEEGIKVLIRLLLSYFESAEAYSSLRWDGELEPGEEELWKELKEILK